MAPIIDWELPHHGLGKERRRSSRMLVFAMILVAVLMIGGVAGLMVQTGSNEGPHPSETPARIPVGILYATHSPILINGNAEFTTENGVSGGDGSISDPYIIADWDINASSAHGIQIENCDVHFVISNCYLHDGLEGLPFYNNYGVCFRNVTNGSVIDNTISANDMGIFLYSSDAVTITSNTCSNNQYGLFLQGGSRGNTIANNTCTVNIYEGIVLDTGSDNNILSDNNCSGNSADSIWLKESNNNTLSGNDCSGGDYGIFVVGFSQNNTLISNNCSSNTYESIYVDQSSNNTLVDNICISNAIGIALYRSDRNTLIDNNCSSNSNDGILLLSGSSNNTLVSNQCFWNLWNGVNVGTTCNNNTLVSNDCSLNTLDGIVLIYSTNSTVDSNNCSSNRCGVYVYNSSGNVLLRNQLCNNSWYGVILRFGSSSSLVFNNTFIGNNGAGSTYDSDHVQAFDDATNNCWWNSTDGYGNYWSDWTSPDVVPPYGIVDQPYVITGGTGASDFYPQTTPQQPIPELGVFPLVVIALLAMMVLIRERRRGKA